MTQIDTQPFPLSTASFVQAACEPPPAVLFERLLARYQRRFGTVPEMRNAAVEEVNQLLRHGLAEASRRPEG